MDTSSPELFLHVPGTEQSVPLPKKVIRQQIAEGTITRSQLIWSPLHNAWKQVRELPELLPSQRLAPAPAAPLRRATIPLAAAVASPAARPVPVAQAPEVKRGRPAARREIPLESGWQWASSPLVWGVFLVAVALGTVVGLNYTLVQAPLSQRLSATSYRSVLVYAHLGAYVQPSGLVIHVPPNDAVRESNLLDFLGTVAIATPPPPLNGPFYQTVALTSAWTAQYDIAGADWKKFGNLPASDSRARRIFLLQHLYAGKGQSLLRNPDEAGTTLGAVPPEEEKKAWRILANSFAASGR